MGGQFNRGIPGRGIDAQVFGPVILTALMIAIAHIDWANVADVMSTKNIGPYRVELHVLPAEPFFNKQDVAPNT